MYLYEVPKYDIQETEPVITVQKKQDMKDAESLNNGSRFYLQL